MKTLRTVLITLAVVAAVALAICYGGFFNMAADDHHWGMTSGVIDSMRDRNVARQAHDVVVPKDLADEKLIANGAGEYAEMCTGCHLAPGMKDTELRKGLYPMPPNLAEPGARRSVAEQFWIVKHGLKMTGMPAWGLTHDDERIWSMVAFLQKLPSLSPEQYQDLAKSGGGHHHDDDMAGPEGAHDEEAEEHHHDHAEGDKAEHDHDAAKGSGGQEPGEHTHEHASTPATTTALPAGAVDAAAVVDRFQALLAKGNTTAAAELLEPSVLIFESGGAEKSRAEYASHHLKEDAKFMKTATLSPLSRTGAVSGDLAFIATEASLKAGGSTPVDLVTTETMVLKRTPKGWRVAHVHWSSRKVK